MPDEPIPQEFLLDMEDGAYTGRVIGVEFEVEDDEVRVFRTTDDRLLVYSRGEVHEITDYNELRDKWLDATDFAGVMRELGEDVVIDL
jgi:hypothetical protein